jgi:maltodextrin utilization protein YvdJ
MEITKQEIVVQSSKDAQVTKAVVIVKQSSLIDIGITNARIDGYSLDEIVTIVVNKGSDKLADDYVKKLGQDVKIYDLRHL